jgi:hypothetical protein
MQVGEIAATAAGNEDLLARSLRPFENNYAPPAPPAFGSAHQAGGAGAQNDRVEGLVFNGV